MTGLAPIESLEYTNLLKVIKWFIKLRWVACVGVFLVLLVTDRSLKLQLPYAVLYSLNLVLLLANLLFSLYYLAHKKANLSRRALSLFFHTQICSDYILLFLLLYFTGFMENPFSFYFVFHLVLTSFIFSSGTVALYTGLLVVLISLASLGEYFRLLPHFPLFIHSPHLAAYFDQVIFRSLGLSSVLIISCYLINTIMVRLEARGIQCEIELSRYKSLDKVKSNFLLQVTHELRGPLAAIKAYHEVILKGITGPIQEKTTLSLGKADHRIDNLINMIDEMIDFAYMKTDEEMSYQKKNLSLKEIIDYNLALFTPRAGQKNITFHTSCPRNLKLWTNRDLMNIILNNLITNAIKYSPAGSSITINGMEENGEVHIVIKDQGIGIAKEELGKIFEEFYRTRRARQLERDGTGLGLSIIQKAARALGGRITVYSEKGKGASFHIYLKKQANKT